MLHEVLVSPDDLKFVSAKTLFVSVAEDSAPFEVALARWSLMLSADVARSAKPHIGTNVLGIALTFRLYAMDRSEGGRVVDHGGMDAHRRHRTSQISDCRTLRRRAGDAYTSALSPTAAERS
ncbi:hypothetical protein [uncultured Brevundimonas sp.]|uniref:hypothetical protein n=1 Tax=uncultured Brevundimonas sp. TaxID=213418 RepID=UPI00341FA0E8